MEIMSLRSYINNKEQIGSIKIETFCRLMKLVSDKIEKEDRNIIRINLDEISINIKTGEIILSDNLFTKVEDLDKTMAGFNTGISLMADRKSTKEHKRVAFALMVLGWYCNEDGSAVINDLMVLENFDKYMSNVPNWLHDFFINIFRKMDYNQTFSEYYDDKFNKKIKNDIEVAFAPYNLTSEQFDKVARLVALNTSKLIREGGK